MLCWRCNLKRVELSRIQHALAETTENSQDQLLRVSLRRLRPSLYQMDVPMVWTVCRPPPVEAGEGDRVQDVIIVGHPPGGLPNETGTILVDTAGAEPALVPSQPGPRSNLTPGSLSTSRTDGRDQDEADHGCSWRNFRPNSTPFVEFHTEAQVGN